MDSRGMTAPSPSSAPLPAVPTAPTPVEAPDSLTALLRSKRKRQAMQRRRIFEVPGYDGLLGAKFRSADAASMFRDEAAQLDEAEVTDANIAEIMRARRSLIARSCVSMHVRTSSIEEWTPLHEYLGDDPRLGPITFDERLALWAGADPNSVGATAEISSATDAVAFIISYDFNLASMWTTVVSWFAQESPSEADELVGGSSAAS